MQRVALKANAAVEGRCDVAGFQAPVKSQWPWRAEFKGESLTGVIAVAPSANRRALAASAPVDR
jgi:hypothetical protein